MPLLFTTLHGTDPAVLADIQYAQIAQAIIVAIAIDVINVFFGAKFPSKMLLYDVPMFLHADAIDGNAPVSSLWKRAALCNSVAFRTTVKLISNSRWRNIKWLLAYFAAYLHGAVVVGFLPGYCEKSLPFTIRKAPPIDTRSRAKADVSSLDAPHWNCEGFAAKSAFARYSYAS